MKSRGPQAKRKFQSMCLDISLLAVRGSFVKMIFHIFHIGYVQAAQNEIISESTTFELVSED